MKINREDLTASIVLIGIILCSAAPFAGIMMIATVAMLMFVDYKEKKNIDELFVVMLLTIMLILLQIASVFLFFFLW